jgi:hypothetical protein
MYQTESFAAGVHDGYRVMGRWCGDAGQFSDSERRAYLEGYEYGLVAELAEAEAIDNGIDAEAERSRA